MYALRDNNTNKLVTSIDSNGWVRTALEKEPLTFSSIPDLITSLRNSAKVQLPMADLDIVQVNKVPLPNYVVERVVN